jgi:hypothetical protein
VKRVEGSRENQGCEVNVLPSPCVPALFFSGLVRNKQQTSRYQDLMISGARVSSISSRGDGLDPNLLYPPLEEGPPLFSHFSQK